MKEALNQKKTKFYAPFSSLFRFIRITQGCRRFQTSPQMTHRNFLPTVHLVQTVKRPLATISRIPKVSVNSEALRYVPFPQHMEVLIFRMKP